MKIRVCDICKKEKELFFKCKIKYHTPYYDNGYMYDDTMWFRAEICEDCLMKIMYEVRVNDGTERKTD